MNILGKILYDAISSKQRSMGNGDIFVGLSASTLRVTWAEFMFRCHSQPRPTRVRSI